MSDPAAELNPRALADNLAVSSGEVNDRISDKQSSGSNPK